MVVISGNEGHGCANDSQAIYPQLLFATGDDQGAPETMEGEYCGYYLSIILQSDTYRMNVRCHVFNVCLTKIIIK
ncbi:hypothetical protein DPMN_078538 [Dreissena polymorpha]|uniref:Uncharacterized protein n=1 Tax=Dreissena polymorpha TaxID=45954 RepID=A0A9D4BQL0_DREPO|nr:hypothetical protein DPMN_078538 [Dreissena polymorpha]